MTSEPRPRFIYLLPEGLGPTVIDSQVITVLRRMAERGLVFELFAYQSRPPPTERAQMAARLADVRKQLCGRVRLWTWPSLDILVRRQRRAGDPTPAAAATERRMRLLWGARRLALSARDRVQEGLLLAGLAESMRRGDTIVVHARGAAMPLAIRLKRQYSGFRVLADFRGDSAAEFLYTARDGGLSPDSSLVRREYERLRAVDREVVAKADIVQCVSEALRARLVEDHGVARERIRVVPCLADEESFRYRESERTRLRRDLDLRDTTVFVYSGSLSGWQNSEWLLKAWRRLTKRLPRLHLLVVTPETDRARGLAAANGLGEAEISIRSARHQEVAGYLSAADVGLLVREPHPLNAVASPTKFAEYVLCGLPVLVSRGIGDLDGLVERHALGVLLDACDDENEVERKVVAAAAETHSGDRGERARRGAKLFGLGPHLDAWSEVYRRLSGLGSGTTRGANEADGR